MPVFRLSNGSGNPMSSCWMYKVLSGPDEQTEKRKEGRLDGDSLVCLALLSIVMWKQREQFGKIYSMSQNMKIHCKC